MTAGAKREESVFSVEDAIDRVWRYPSVPGVQEIPVPAALRRILAEDVIAGAPVPAYSSSAMDGYAFRFADLAAGHRLRVDGRAAAGHPLPGPLARGSAVRIFTGGALPDGADTVAMQESCKVDEDFVVVPGDLAPGANRRFAGDDIPSGATVLRSGTRLRPQDLGIATAVGRTTVTVHRGIRACVLVTGDELRAPGEALPPGCVYDSNRQSVSAALRGLGAEVTDLGRVPDDRSVIRAALAGAAEQHDLIISTGGMSVGDEDHVRAAVLECGSLDFWKLPLKPGRPVAVGSIGDAAFVGLPGNPVSAMTAFWLLGRPLALRLMGLDRADPPRFPVVATFSHRHSRGRVELLRVRLCTDEHGRLGVEKYGSPGAGVLSSLTWSDGLAEIAADSGDVRAGDQLSYLPYCGLD